MKLIEFGAQNEGVVVLLHGGGLSWWNYREEAQQLQHKYHVVLPILDGHAGSDSGFTSIENNASELLEYIDKHFGGSVLAMCGLSLGGQILVEMLSQQTSICQYAMIESALAIAMPFTRRLVGISASASYGLIKKPWFSKLQFDSLNIQKSLYDDYYRDSCEISKEDMLAFLKASSSYQIRPELAHTKTKTKILYGSKEQKSIKDSAALLHKTIKNSELGVLDGYTHGNLSLNHPKEYVTLLEKWIASSS